MCDNCYSEDKKFETMTAVGKRAFCSEKCYCLYIDVPFKGEGYWGLNPYKSVSKDVELLSLISWARIWHPEMVIEYGNYEREVIKLMREQE
tara:strand:- start:44 stop:316 length:273 start_codon:yes stop_codon:yes gene_type:complete